MLYLPVISYIKNWNTYVAPKTLSSEGGWENLQQQVLPSSSLYKQHVFSKIKKENSSFKWRRLREYTLLNGQQLPSKFLLETTSILIYMHEMWKATLTAMMLSTAKKHQIASEGCKMTEQLHAMHGVRFRTGLYIRLLQVFVIPTINTRWKRGYRGTSWAWG